MPLFTPTIHRYIYLFGLALLAFSLPLSSFGTSISELILLGNWIAEGNFKEKFSKLKSKNGILFFSSIFIVHVIWLLPPQDYNYAFNDLKVKVPILVLPILIGSSYALTKKLLKSILLFFTSGVLLGTLISITIFIFKQSVNITNYRDLSPFISHIRFSLMIAFSIFIFMYYSFNKNETAFKGIWKICALIASVWLIVFLILLKSLTGIVIFGIISYLIFWFLAFKIKHWLKWVIFLFLIVLPVLPSIYIYNVLINFTKIEEIDFSSVDTRTESGKYYTFVPDAKSVENGKLVWIYVCENELMSEWQKRSKIDYFDKDRNGNDLRFTLIRFLTSKGLRKDSAGISRLNSEEINAIENGVPNYLFLSEWKIYPIVYNVIWELYEYKYNKQASGHSVAQRIEYLKAAKEIISANFFFGVGTGNVQHSFDKQYEIMQSKLDKEWRLRAHNQLVTFFLTFGVFGFIFFIFMLFYPVIKEKGYKDFLFSVLFLIMFLSFFNEDTLESQAGVTFFVLFYCLFLFSGKQEVVHTEQ
ncbi:MAG: O-antigen ligase family protein [Bacteroidia bacterium]|nr:O-antigen ligase family protein [Bacteroidia bacterium]